MTSHILFISLVGVMVHLNTTNVLLKVNLDKYSVIYAICVHYINLILLIVQYDDRSLGDKFLNPYVK